MHKTGHAHIRGILLGLCALAVMGLMAGPVLAGSLEPPPEAVDGVGDPVGTEHPLEEVIVGNPDPAERFTVVLGGAGMRDAKTTLVWEQSLSTTGRNHADSIAYCAGLNLGGQSDWRLPEVQELGSLVDYANFTPSLPSGHPFSNVRSSTYWSAAFFASNPNFAWVVFFSNGNVSASIVGNDSLAWCVR